MVQVSDRKVNKPRLTLRKPVYGRYLHPMYRGVVPFLLSFGVSEKNLKGLSPEAILGIFASFMNRDAEVGYVLSKQQWSVFRNYLELNGIQDWTRESHESGKRKETASTVRGKAAK